MPFEVTVIEGPSSFRNREESIQRVGADIAAAYQSAKERKGRIVGEHVLNVASSRGSVGPGVDWLYLVTELPEETIEM